MADDALLSLEMAGYRSLLVLVRTAGHHAVDQYQWHKQPDAGRGVALDPTDETYSRQGMVRYSHVFGRRQGDGR